MNDEERAKLLIPDVRCILRPLSEIYFNDIAERASLIPAGNHFIAHDLVDDTMARKLNLARLGLKFVDLTIPGIDMGEKPVTTVRNTLRQYTEQQFVTEFVANACDANATKLTLLINEFFPSANENPRLLSPAMQKFSSCPSLVVYNNEKFSDQDFKGICQTSIGGKEGKSNTIGQFGLGALTMFHITEVWLPLCFRVSG
jgi:sacsin